MFTNIYLISTSRSICTQPVSESRHLHRSIDLTTQAVYRIGRSDTSDLQLLHCASSRRHAILFHHPNGHCYLVDCGSAHGTYVNGHKVESTVTKNGVVPHRVKKGAIVRFGGAGAPAFILKSFSVSLSSLMQHLERRKTITRKTNIIQDEPPLSYMEKHSDSEYSMDALVTVNTRLNSVQSVSDIPLSGNSNYSKTAAFLNARHKNSSLALHMRKRSLLSFDEGADDEQDHKRLKLSSSIESEASNDSINPAIVSPSRGKSVLQFDFSMIDRPVVSPNPFEDSTKTLELNAGSLENSILTVPLSLSLPTTHKKKKKKKVMFSKAPPQIFFPASVTPDSLSDWQVIDLCTSKKQTNYKKQYINLSQTKTNTFNCPFSWKIKKTWQSTEQ